MPYILNIETSTEVCSVALAENKKIILEKAELNGPSHASLLGVFADDVIKYAKKQNIKLDAVAVSRGPGSYTGLRIGVSEAKGLCFGLGIPLIAIDTLYIMASGIKNKIKPGIDTYLCPMIDARRMEVYAAIFDPQLKQVRKIQADIVDENTYKEYLDKHKIIFFGNGADKCRDKIKHNNAVFIDNIYPLSTDMVPISVSKFQKKEFEDVAYFEPFYLKEFIATTPQNKVIK